MNRRALGLALEIVTPIAVFALLWVWTANSESIYAPPLSEVLEAFQRNWLFDRVGSDLVPSLRRIAFGWSIAVLVGVSVGVLLGLWPLARRLTSALVEFGRALPLAALIPFVIIVFGFDDSGKILLIALACVWFVLLNTIDGVRGIDPLYKETSSSYGISGFRRLRSVILPAAFPQIWAGMRISVSIALLGMILSELVSSTNGVGAFVLRSQRAFAITDMWSGILLLGILGYLLNLLALGVERRVLAWHRGARNNV